jgi:hypothetical protein
MWMWPSADAAVAYRRLWIEALSEPMDWYSTKGQMHQKTKEYGVLPRAGDTHVSLILASLSNTDFDVFHAARIPYSGSTGKGAVQGYEPYGPYIATFWGEFERSMAALGWHHIELQRTAEHQVVVRWAPRQQHQAEREAMRDAEATAQVLVRDTVLASSPGTNAKENGDRPSVSIEWLTRVVERQERTIAELTKAVQANALTAINAIERSR